MAEGFGLSDGNHGQNPKHTSPTKSVYNAPATKYSTIFDPMLTGQIKGQTASTHAESVAAVRGIIDPSGFLGRTFDRRKRDNAAMNALLLAMWQEQMQRRQMADDARGRWERGELSEGQQAAVKSFKDQSKQALMRSLYDRGMSDSSVAVDEQGRIDLAAIGMEQQMINEDFTRYMEALGMSSQAADVIASVHENDRQQAIAVYQSFMSAIGGAASYVGNDQTIDNTTNTNSTDDPSGGYAGVKIVGGNDSAAV